MKLRKTIFGYIACAGLTACGITAPDNVVGYTYVSGTANGALPDSTTKGSTTSDTNATTGTSGTTTSGTTTTGTTTTGAATGGATNGNSTSGTTAGGSTTTGSTTSSTPTYTLANLSADMNAVLQARSPSSSDTYGNLGNPANIALWTQSPLQSLYDGLLVTQASYYPSLSLQDLAHLILALGATDSTGDYTLNNGSTVGYLQVSTANGENDYINHGLAIQGENGELISPSNISLGVPGANLALMAWYSRNAVSSGESADEASTGAHNHVVTRDVGNAVLAWLAGPGLDRHSNPPTSWPAFYARLADYYVQSNFGTQASFDAIMNTSMPSTLQGFKDAPAGAFP